MATDAEIRAWARERGVKVSDRGAIGARLRAEYDTVRGATPAGPPLLPGPDEIAEDAGIIDVGETPVPRVAPEPGPAPERPAEAGREPDDEPPPHARREWRQKPRRASRAKAAAPPRVLAGVRQDITAKVSFALMVPGSIWQARDPLCGGTFVQQVPETADAFTDIICDSPDMIAFFTGPGGNFMKALKVGAALMPVAQMYMAHHVYHSIEVEESPVESEPGPAQYAA